MEQMWPYAAIVIAMVVSGMFFPEEPAMVACGVAAKSAGLDLPWAIACCVLGVLLADLILYTLGRYGGRALLVSSWGERLLPSPRRTQLEQGFHRSGEWMLIVARVLPVPGVRTSTFVAAGLLRFSLCRFLLLDLLFLGLTTSLLLAAGYQFRFHS